MKLKQKPNGIYFIDVKLPDADNKLTRSRVSFDTRDRASAETQLVDWIKGIHPKHPSQGGVIAPKGRAISPDTSEHSNAPANVMTLNLWLTRCLSSIWSEFEVKSHASKRSNVKILQRYIDSDLALADVTATHLTRLVDNLRAGGYAAGTVRLKISHVATALNHAAKTVNPETGKFYLETVPEIPNVPKVRSLERVVSRDEEAVILECIDERHRTDPQRMWWWFKRLVILQLDLGFRLSEALSLGQRSVKRKRWLDHSAQSHLEATFIGVEGKYTKSGKPRDIPCSQRFEREIKLLNELASNGRWFPWPIKSSTPWQMWNTIRMDMKARGYNVDDVVQHTFRHTCATRLCEGGLDLVSLRDWLGHSDISITAETYIHLMSTHLHKGAAILNAGTSGSPNQFEDDLMELSSIRNSADLGTNGDNLGTPLLN